jgi:threonyl-tRNA synthetase
MLVVGDREAETGTVSVRERSGGDKGASSIDAFVAAALDEIARKGQPAPNGSQLSAVAAEN